MMYSDHPPDVVTFTRPPAADGRDSDASPLPSAPNSPREDNGAPPTAGLWFQATADLLEDLVNQHQQQHEQRKEVDDENTELEIQNNTRREADEEDDVEEPGRLVVNKHEGPFDEDLNKKLEEDAGTENGSEEKKEDERKDGTIEPQEDEMSEPGDIQISLLSAPALGTSGIRRIIGEEEGEPPSLARSSDEKDSFMALKTLATPTPASLSSTIAVDKLVTTPLLRRTTLHHTRIHHVEDKVSQVGIVEASKPTPVNTRLQMRTPQPPLQSPPPLVKTKMAWEEDPGENHSSVGELDPASSRVPTQETETPNKRCETPPWRRSMVSPNGELEIVDALNKDVVLVVHPSDLKEESTDRVLEDQRTNDKESSEPSNSNLLEIPDKDDDPDYYAVIDEKPFVLSARSQSDDLVGASLVSRQEAGLTTEVFDGLEKPDSLPPRSDALAESMRSAGDWRKYLNKETDLSAIKVDVSKWLDTFSRTEACQTETAPSTKNKYREMTSNRDMQTSEKGARWLREEFKRRSSIKEEINKAILSRTDLRDPNSEMTKTISPTPDYTDDTDEIDSDLHELPDEHVNFASELSKALETLPRSPIGCPVKAEISHHSEDDEVAALTSYGRSTAGNARPGIPTVPSDEDGAPRPRRLDYEPLREFSTSAPPLDSYLNSRNIQYSSSSNPYQQEMHRFANETRAALQGQNRTNSGAASDRGQFRSLAVTSAVGQVDENCVEVAATFDDKMADSRPSSAPLSDISSDHSHLDISATPVLVHCMDSHLGIARGDVTLSLLNEHSEGRDNSPKATWANRVHDSIWRIRRMRRSMGGLPVIPSVRTPGSAAKGRSSLPVDLDAGRVAGGARNVQATQEAALGHLKLDEIDEAIELFEDIIFAYYAYFERTLEVREANLGGSDSGITDFRPYIGVALHNLGILNLLKGEYYQAKSYFGRAVENRGACLGEGHSDHVASLVKLATCHYALNEFSDANNKFEEALVHARRDAQELGDRMQMAEILNNLGCLAHMCGRLAAANSLFRESMDVQFSVMNQSLYVSSAAVGQSISLNISITRANIGFIRLVTSDFPVAVTAFENALMEQQLILRGANASLLATMDHLAVANLLYGETSKAALIFGRILEMQEREFGPRDPRCLVTQEKINTVKSRGPDFEQALDELRKTFSVHNQYGGNQTHSSASFRDRGTGRSRAPSVKSFATSNSPQYNSSPGQMSRLQNENKVMKVLKSMRKKKLPRAAD